jgi:hypothetical protein
VRERQNREAQTLADLTGWDMEGIMKNVGLTEPPSDKAWWKGLWN